MFLSIFILAVYLQVRCFSLLFVFFSEVCPFCGKTYKRLKSHLPHCKAAGSSSTPPIGPGAAQTQGPARLSSLKPDKSPQKLTVKAGLQPKKSKTVSSASSPTGFQTGKASTSLPSSAKKKKQKLSEQIKAAITPPCAAVSPPSQPRSLHPTKKTTIHDEGAPKRSRATVEEPPAAQPEAEARVRGKEGISGNQGSSQRKGTQALPSSQNYKPNERTTGAREGNQDWVTTEGKDLNTDPGNGRQSKITLQGVKAALGRDRKSSRPSLVLQIQSSDPSSSAASTQASLPAGSREEQLLSTSSTKPASANPRRHHAPPQLAPASPLPPPPCPPRSLSSQVHRALTGLPTVSPSLTQFTRTKLLPASVEALGARDQLGGRKLNIPDSRTKSWLERREPTLDSFPEALIHQRGPSVPGSGGVPAQQHLANVRLKELPAWLALHSPTNPRDAAKMVQRGECHAYLAPVLKLINNG